MSIRPRADRHARGRYHTARWCAATALALTLLGSSQAALAGPAVTLKANLPSGQLVGTAVTWTATVGGSTKPVYRFSVVVGSARPSVVRDFSFDPSFTWTPLQEGTYTLQVTAKGGYTDEAMEHTSATFVVKSRVTGKSAVVSRTANPLVALYSAPACAKGSLVVQFRQVGAKSWQGTAAQPCVAGRSVNVLVAGMRPSTAYELRHVISGGPSITSTSLRFTTGKPPAALKITKFTVAQAPTNQADHSTPVIFHALIPNPSPSFANPIATDLAGNLVWYYDTLRSGLSDIWPVHIVAGGTVLLLGLDKYRATGDDVLREVDLAGNVVHETNIDTVNAQLASRGQEPIYMFHHDAIRLPNGDTAVLGATQNRVNGQNVMSDMVVVLDSNLQVVWTWDMFDHFTPPATFPDNTGTCSVLCDLPDKKSIDWTHGNGLAWSPKDQDLIVSFRQISLVVKINFQNGKGDGSVVWRLGKGGNFTLQSSDPYPWFSLQHNANFITPTTVVVFDDGNTRCQNGKVQGCQSRGQVYTLDEQHHVATLVQSVNLGKYFQALGSAQGLANGNTTYAGGFSPPSKEVEFTRTGTKVYELDTTVAEYRAYRLTGMSY